MKPTWYYACEKFGPGTSEGWPGYMAWARLPQLVEVVSLDLILCPSVIRDLTREDWMHNVKEDYRTDFFKDLDYLLRRVKDLSVVNILAAITEPDEEDLKSFHEERFVFKGFDLIEGLGTGISALVNCGGFNKAFSAEDINLFGLISDFEAAREIQQRLFTYYPDEHHAHCSLWAIWRLEN